MSDPTTIDADSIDRPPEPPEGLAYLVVRRGEASHVIDLADGDEVVIGRAAEATVQIDDARVSREHARLIHRDGALRVRDLGSRNGTRLNDETLRGEERALASGDLLRIGDAEIVVAGTLRRPEAAPQPPEGTARPFIPPSGVVVADAAMVKLFHLVRRVAAMPTTVLLLGETGSGKEVVAEQIHLQSPRAGGPLVKLNCGSLPETLLESELFGHERGAFTGADKRNKGYLEAAHGGTLFLDEIGELTAATQAKLLRVIEERRFMRVGGREEVAVDVRLVAATHRDLEAAVREGRFREDLYFRLSSFVLRVPPLRERPAEIALLAELFARRFAERMGEGPPTITADAAAVLRAHRWPGNVRELRNAIEHAMVLAEEGEVRAEHLPPSVAAGGARRADAEGDAPAGPMKAHLESVEQRAIEEALAAEGGNQTRAAKRLGISRRALIYKIGKYGLRGNQRGGL